MVKSSVDWIEELTAKERKHLEAIKRLHIMIGLDSDMKLPRHYKFAEDFLLATDRLLFGEDDSFRRKIFGMTPWIMKPAYFVYDCFYQGWYAKQPLKKSWWDAKKRYDYERLMQDRREYNAKMKMEKA